MVQKTGGLMKCQRFSLDQIVRLLCEAESLRSGGLTTIEACHKLDISLNTYHRWCKLYDGMDVDHVH